MHWKVHILKHKWLPLFSNVKELKRIYNVMLVMVEKVCTQVVYNVMLMMVEKVCTQVVCTGAMLQGTVRVGLDVVPHSLHEQTVQHIIWKKEKKGSLILCTMKHGKVVVGLTSELRICEWRHCTGTYGGMEGHWQTRKMFDLYYSLTKVYFNFNDLICVMKITNLI